jgi:hypothetical protein
VDRARVVGVELVGGDPGVLLELDRQGDAHRLLLPVPRDDELDRRLDDQVGLAEQPIVEELFRHRQIAARPLRCAAFDPGGDEGDLARREGATVAVLVVARIGLPRGHASGEELLLDRRRPGTGSGLAVGAVHGEVGVLGGDPARTVAAHAVLTQNGADVVPPGDVGGDARVGHHRRCREQGQAENAQGSDVGLEVA